MSETSKLENDNKISVGKETEGGITSSYAVDDGVVLKVPYSFFGSIYDENEEKAVLAAMHKDSLTMGAKVQEFQTMFKEKLGVKHALAVSNCTTCLLYTSQTLLSASLNESKRKEPGKSRSIELIIEDLHQWNVIQTTGG